MIDFELPIFGFLILSALLFGIGIGVVLVKKNPIMILIGIEIMMVAGNINLVAFGRNDPERMGLIFSIFTIILGVCELAVGMAIIIQSYNFFKEKEFSDFDNHEEGN